MVHLYILQYSSGKRTKKLFIPNIGVSRTCQKHSESNRVNVILASPPNVCVMRSYAKLLGMVILYPGGNISRKAMRNSSE